MIDRVPGTLRAEWTKLRTVRSTAWLPSVAAALTLGLTAVVCAVTDPAAAACAGGCDPVELALSGVLVGQGVVVAVAVLAITGEYQTGLIGPTLTAAPRRLALYWAKTAALVAATLPLCLLGVVAALLAGRALLTGSGAAPFALQNGATLRAAAGTVVYLCLVALLSFGLATAIRGTAPALVTVLALLYLAPLLARLVTAEPWHTRLEKYAPMTAGLAVQATTDLEGQPLGPWTGLAVLAGYAAAALALGAVLFTTRDA